MGRSEIRPIVKKGMRTVDRIGIDAAGARLRARGEKP